MAKKIRQLLAGEPIPSMEPKRYINSSGYVRLRWHVSPDESVEVYEHRIVAGVVGTSLHVHHRNGVKDCNDPSNLEVIDSSAHSKRHHPARFDRDQAALMYRQGMSTVAIGARLGVNAASVYRALQRHGHTFRKITECKRVSVSLDAIASLYVDGLNVCQIARALGVGRNVITSRLRDLGLTPRPGGHMPGGQHAPTAERMRQIQSRLKKAG